MVFPLIYNANNVKNHIDYSNYNLMNRQKSTAKQREKTPIILYIVFVSNIDAFYISTFQIMYFFLSTLLFQVRSIAKYMLQYLFHSHCSAK